MSSSLAGPSSGDLPVRFGETDGSGPRQDDQASDQLGIDDGSDEEEEEETLTMKLLRVWSNERLAPEILHHQEPLLELAMDRVQQQSTALEVLFNNPEGLSSEEHFRLTLIETEIEQLRYLCKAYSRTRMFKLDKFFDHCLIDGETRSKLSKVDLEYCKREQTLVHNLMFGSVLEGLPSKYHRLDEDHMIVRPDLDHGVFISVRRSCGPVYLPNSESIMLKKDSKHFLRYRSIKKFLESEHVKLI
ncbi:hypothetical protein BY996DRAFT_8386820 [Phakopsora pachyrhizi]|uniref:DNA replication complex GINS protein SLD5 n=1 Tax=Phakopsora pachyrhizi TaxID=170000 RepID=A0AAV0BTN2_PHAPC|nr:hypothetical protein BY996DRAFT_8386820 [Phakopsora pachyrhizi]CAH7690766.1 hypothetical protein PPACK8108_LOCUS26199 [Phakopsora pachyrhizi]